MSKHRTAGIPVSDVLPPLGVLQIAWSCLEPGSSTRIQPTTAPIAPKHALRQRTARCDSITHDRNRLTAYRHDTKRNENDDESPQVSVASPCFGFGIRGTNFKKVRVKSRRGPDPRHTRGADAGCNARVLHASCGCVAAVQPRSGSVGGGSDRSFDSRELPRSPVTQSDVRDLRIRSSPPLNHTIEGPASRAQPRRPLEESP